MPRRKFTSERTAEDVNPLEGVEPFEVDDQEFRCEGELSVLEISDLARRVTSSDDSPESQASLVASMSETLRMAMGDAEYQRFRAHVAQHHTPDRVVIDIMQAINEEIQEAVEKIAERPTGKPQPSSGGPAATGERMSRIISLQSGDVTVLPAPGDHQPPTARPGAKAKPRGRRATA